MSRAAERPRVALTTCATLRTGECDDVPLRRAFVDRGVEVVEPCWDDPTIDWSTFDVTLIRTTWDYVARVDEYRRWIDHVDAVGNLVNPAPVVRWNIDKRYLLDLEAQGAPIIPTLWIEPPNRFDASRCRAWLSGQGDPRRLFVKPAIGATASDTLRTGADDAGLDAAARHADRLLAGGVAVLVQPYLTSVESVGEHSAIIIEGRLTHAVVKRPRPGDYRVQDDWGGTDAPHHPNAAESRLIDAALAALGAILGRDARPLAYVRIDWLLDDAGAPRLVELESIEPSLFFRHGSHAAAALADAVLRRRRPLPKPHDAGAASR